MSAVSEDLMFDIEDIYEPHSTTTPSLSSSTGLKDRRASDRAGRTDNADDDSAIADQRRRMGSHGFQGLAHDSDDVVLALAYSDRGDRLVTGAADHRIRVMKVVGEDEWTMMDVWRGHDGAVLDVQQSPSFLKFTQLIPH